MAQEIDELKQRVLRTHLADLSANDMANKPSNERGYLDPDGNATPLGSEFLTITDAGLMDDAGNLTDEGRVYATPYEDARDNTETPEGQRIYRLREERGLNDIDKGEQPGAWEGLAKMVGDFTTKSLPRFAETIYESDGVLNGDIANKVSTYFGGKAFIKKRNDLSIEERTNRIAENLTGGILSTEPIGSGAIYNAELAAADPGSYMAMIADKVPIAAQLTRLVYGDAAVNENIRMKTEEAYAAKQRWEKHNAEITALKGAQMMDSITGGDQWMKNREALVSAKGEEVVKQGEEADRLGGNILLGGENLASVAIGAGVKAGIATSSRATLAAEKLALRSRVLATRSAAAAAERATLEAGATTAAATIQKSTEKAAAMRAIGDEAKAVRYEAVAQRVGERSQNVASRITELAETESKLASEIEGIGAKAGVAEAIVATSQRIAALRQFPAQTIGQITESLGAGLVKTDEFLSAAIDKMGGKYLTKSYDAARSLPGRMFSFSAGPVGQAAAIASQVIESGPLLQSIGNFSKVLGKELIAERGTVPFWRRVANNSTISKPQRFLAHRMDEATLGGMAADVARPVIRGTAKSYPMNLAFEVLQDPNQDIGDAAGRAFAQSLVFGGGAAGGGAIFKGSKERMKSMRIGDEINFTRGLSDPQKSGFSEMSRGGRRMVSTYAAAFPNLNWEFTPDAPSRYDGATNTVLINPASPNPLRALVGHEVLHYTTIRNQMQPVIHSMILGDAETPGLLRHTDGKLTPEFQQFADAYQSRRQAANLEPATLPQLAEEYFNESVVDSLTSMVETGELSKMAGRTQLGRGVRSLIEATIPKSAILKDFFFRTGGAMEAGGRHVMGNGLLADGIREFPEARAMMRKMVRSSAGESITVTKKITDPKEGAGTAIPIAKGDPIIDSFHAILETDASGMPIKDAAGNHIALSRAKDEARSSAGHVISEEQTKRVNAGYLPDADEIKLNADGTWSGKYIPKPLIDKLAAKGILNSKQIAMMRNISTATKTGKGIRYLITNHPATIKGRGGKVRYATLGATLRETVPLQFEISPKGNILVHLINVEQLDKNITNRAASKRGKALYDGNTEVIKQDVAAMMELHSKNEITDPYYQQKYGPAWEEHKNFINTVFGLMNKAEQSLKNPMFESDKVTSKEGVYRTYRLDRISKATKMDGTPMPFGYTHVKGNYLPDGLVEKASISGGNTTQSADGNLRRDTSNGADGRGKPASIYPRPEAGPGSIAEFLSPDRKPPRYNYAFQSAQEISRQSAALSEWAKASGVYLTPPDEKNLIKGNKSKSGGSEHTVWRFSGEDGGYVIKKTLGPGGFTGAAPAQYLDRWSDFGRLYPTIQPEVIGVSDGHIFVKQRFIQGEVYSDPKILEADMNADGWDKVGTAKFKHRETGAVISDARPDNVIKGLDGKIWPFDVMVDEVGNN